MCVFILVAIFFLDEFTRSGVKNCSCPKPCDVTSYETRLSYAQYPSEHAKEAFANYSKIINNISSSNVKDINKYLG